MKTKKGGPRSQQTDELFVIRWDTGADVWFVSNGKRDTRSKKQARKFRCSGDAERVALSLIGDYQVVNLRSI